MNIFVVDRDPITAAQSLCDQHVSKMTLETAQILCTLFEQGEAPYRRTHYNHPCCVWARASKGNVEWLITHGRALAEEFEYRRGKSHKSREVIEWVAAHSFDLPKGMTPFARAVGEDYQDISEDIVEVYRSFYRGTKASFARWNWGRPAPIWWNLEKLSTPDRLDEDRRRV